VRVTLARNDRAASRTLLQGAAWARFKAEAGWTAERYSVMAEDSPEPFGLSVLLRSVAGGRCFAYIPRGPHVDVAPERRQDLLVALSRALAAELPRRCMFLRWDLPWYAEEETLGTATDNEEGDADAPTVRGDSSPPPALRPVFDRPLVKAAGDVQPPDTVVIDLRASEDEILAGMKPKWRYNIRYAFKKGVAVADEGPGAVDTFYDLYRTTAVRDRIALHPRDYYARLLERSAADRTAGSNGAEPVLDARLWVARVGGQAIAAIITAFYGKEAYYLYGASGDGQRNLMPAYALQWTAMRAARDAGCTTYDLYGIPPSPDPNHPMAGLYRFKTGFGGRIRRYAGTWDYPLESLPYAAFRAAERLRLFWHKDLKKRAAVAVVADMFRKRRF